jgi:hypothetical protein
VSHPRDPRDYGFAGTLTGPRGRDGPKTQLLLGSERDLDVRFSRSSVVAGMVSAVLRVPLARPQWPGRKTYQYAAIVMCALGIQLISSVTYITQSLCVAFLRVRPSGVRVPGRGLRQTAQCNFLECGRINPLVAECGAAQLRWSG